MEKRGGEGSSEWVGSKKMGAISAEWSYLIVILLFKLFKSCRTLIPSH